MRTREIPIKQWGDFFAGFSRKHEDWLVELEAFNNENAEPLDSQNFRLKSITAEPENDGQDTMIVIVGEGETTAVSHLIRKPLRVLVMQNEDGADDGLIIDLGQTRISIRFRTAVLPELVDGVA